MDLKNWFSSILEWRKMLSRNFQENCLFKNSLLVIWKVYFLMFSSFMFFNSQWKNYIWKWREVLIRKIETWDQSGIFWYIGILQFELPFLYERSPKLVHSYRKFWFPWNSIFKKNETTKFFQQAIQVLCVFVEITVFNLNTLFTKKFCFQLTKLF